MCATGLLLNYIESFLNIFLLKRIRQMTHDARCQSNAKCFKLIGNEYITYNFHIQI